MEKIEEEKALLKDELEGRKSFRDGAHEFKKDQKMNDRHAMKSINKAKYDGVRHFKKFL